MHTQPQPTGAGTVVPLPLDRCRAPSVQHSPLRKHKLDLYVAVARQAELYRTMEPDVVDLIVNGRMAQHGPGDIADQLGRNRIAIAAFSAILATLKEADRRLAEAADRVLTAAGLPSEVR